MYKTNTGWYNLQRKLRMYVDMHGSGGGSRAKALPNTDEKKNGVHMNTRQHAAELTAGQPGNTLT